MMDLTWNDVTDELISDSISMTEENRVKYQVNQHWKVWMPAEDIKMYNKIIPYK